MPSVQFLYFQQQFHVVYCALWISLVFADACDNDTTSDVHGRFSWPDIGVGQSRIITCPIQQSGFETARATRSCTMGNNGLATWEPPITHDCPFESVVTQQLQQLSEASVFVGFCQNAPVMKDTPIQSSHETCIGLDLLKTTTYTISHFCFHPQRDHDGTYDGFNTNTPGH